MKTMQDFKNEESAKQYSLLKAKLSKYGPIGKLIKRNEIINSTNNSVHSNDTSLD